MSAPTPPTVEQMVILANVGARRALNPREAKALRDGLNALAEQQRKANATNAGLQARIRELRQKAETAQRQLALATPHRVPCPTCAAQPGHPCRATRGIKPPPTPHAARLDAATEGRQE